MSLNLLTCLTVQFVRGGFIWCLIMNKKLTRLKDGISNKAYDIPQYISYVLSIYNNNYFEAKYILSKGFNPNQIIGQRYFNMLDLSTPFIDTIRRGYFDLACNMLKCNANVDFKYFSTKNQLILYELLSNCDQEWILILTDNLRKLDDVPYKIKKEWLYYAVEDGNIELCDSLISSGVYPNDISEHGETLLQVAILNKNFRLAHHLMKYKPDLTKKNNRGENILHLCFFHRKHYLIKGDDGYHHSYKIDSSKLADRILYQNIKKSIECREELENSFIGSSFHEELDFNDVFENPNYSCSFKDLEFLETYKEPLSFESYLPIIEDQEEIDLLKFIFSLDNAHELVNERDSLGITPLSLAVKREYFLITKHMLKIGANPNIHDNNKRTAIYFATLKKTMRILLQYGAKHRIRDINLDTPFEYFVRKGIFFSSSGFLSLVKKPMFNEYKTNELIEAAIKRKLLETCVFEYMITESKKKDLSFSLHNEILFNIFKYTDFSVMVDLLTMFLKYGLPVYDLLRNSRYYISFLFLRCHRECENGANDVLREVMGILYQHMRKSITSDNLNEVNDFVDICGTYNIYLEK